MHPYLLSPIDYVFVGRGSQPITFAFSYPGHLDPGMLQNGLARTLESFPAIQSLLRKEDDGAFHFEPCPEGMIFEEATAEDNFSSHHPIGRYIEPVQTLEGEPMTRIRITRTPAGTVLAASISHALVDGFSYFHFLGSWAKACRGERWLAPVPARDYFNRFTGMDTEDFSADAIRRQSGLFLADEQRSGAEVSHRRERFLLDGVKIKQLQEEARAQAGASFTANDVVTAHVWHSFFSQTGPLPPGAALYVTCPVDIRRLAPEVSRLYFGCALCFATASYPAADFRDARLGDLALAVKGAIGAVKADHIAKAMSQLSALWHQRGVEVMERIHLRHPQRGLILTNLTRMPIGELDFGSGPPADFSVYVEVRSSAAILPAQNGAEIFLIRGSG